MIMHMRKGSGKYILALCGAAIFIASCSNARYLEQDGVHYLVSNKVKFTEHTDLATSDITPYIKQEPPGGLKLSRKKRVEYSQELAEASCKSIADHLEYLGYYKSVVEPLTVYKKNKANVTYFVTPGTRYKISEINYKLPQGSSLEADFLDDVPNVSVKVGDYLSEASLEAETARSVAYLHSKGYYSLNANFYSFEADTLSGPDSAILEMRVNEYTRNQTPSEGRMHEIFTIGDVTFSYPEGLKFHNNILKSLNTIKPGAIYDANEVNTTYSRLSALKVFSGVGIELSEAEDNKVNCAINLIPSKLQGFKVNWESSFNSSGLLGISPQLSYYHKSIFHGGEWLNLAFMGNFQRKFKSNIRSEEFGVSAGLSLPRFLGLPYEYFKGPNVPRTEINTSYNYQSRPEYKRHLFSTSYGYSGYILKGLSYQFYPLQLNMVRLNNIDPDFYESISSNPFMKYSYQNHLDAGMGGVLYYTSNTDLVPKTSYHYVRMSLDLSGNMLYLFRRAMKEEPNGQKTIFGTPFSQYVRSEISFGKTWRLGRDNKHALATRLLVGAGLAYGNSSSLPFEKQFYSGGANSLRGWRSRAVGPGDSKLNQVFIIPSQTGDFKLEANIEYRFPVVWKIEGALFAETGNVWTWKSDNPGERLTGEFYKTLAADWGTGVRVDLSFIVLRLDLGFRLHDPAREPGLRWVGPMGWFKSDGCALHFGVGYPF